MDYHLNKINPEFRNLVDLLLFSNRVDLNNDKFHSLMKENYISNINYFFDRFDTASEIFWEEGQELWKYRLSFLFNLNDKGINNRLEKILNRVASYLLKTRSEVNIQFDPYYYQFLEFCKLKYADSKTNDLSFVKSILNKGSSFVAVNKLIFLIESLVPPVYASMDEYIQIIVSSIVEFPANYNLLLQLEKRGHSFNRQYIVSLFKEIIKNKNSGSSDDQSCRVIFSLINDPKTMELIKKEYKPSYTNKLVKLLNNVHLSSLESDHLINIKNLIELDPKLADEIFGIYADRIYERFTAHKKANIDKLIKLIKNIPQISHKKVLAWLSTNNKAVDVKYMLMAFPELKKLSMFV